MYLVDADVYSWQAVKTAVHMLESGADIEEAKDVCSPYDLFQLAKWKVHANSFFCFILVFLGL